MSERGDEAAPALLRVRKASWDAARGGRVLGNVRAEVSQRARRERRGVALLAVAACGLAIVAAWPDRAPVQRGPEASAPVATTRERPEGRRLEFADGSSVELLDERARVEVERVAQGRVEVALLDGKGRFSVAQEADRQFVVRIARLSVAVLGAVVTLTREAERAHVRVERGLVDVHFGDQRRRLVADEAAWFALSDLGAVVGSEELLAPAANAEADSEPRADPARQRFLDHARRRQYARAMEVIRQKPSVVRDNGEELMLAADAARLSGDVQAALPYLRRVTERHSRDTRAPLAAFTLGRVLLFELDRPAEARAAFALTRRLSAKGGLAEDALAREVEAAARAGEHGDARTLAREYLARYPHGLRRAQVLPFAGER